MKKGSQYISERQFYIDKTEVMQKGIELFPSIYIEGAAASGKSTAVQLMLEKHPEVTTYLLDMEYESEAMELFHQIVSASEKIDGMRWMVFENVHAASDASMQQIAERIRRIPSGWRIIFVGRERPAEVLLDLMWKRKMKMISQETLCFTEDDIRIFLEHAGSRLNPHEVYEQTGGWAGCVDMLIRLAEDDTADGARSVEELKSSYEIAEYINRNIIDTLSPDEKEIMRRAAICPWLNEILCSEVWQIPWAGEVLENLRRKGLLRYDKRKQRWKMASLFKSVKVPSENTAFWKHLGMWYDKNGNVREALECLKKSQNEEIYRDCMIRHYSEIPFLEIPYEEVMGWKTQDPELCYLRGFYCYSRQNTEGINAEIQNLNISKDDEKKKREIYLNLTFLRQDLNLDEWLELLETYSKEKEHLHLYHILGYSHTYLCGIRDLSSLFACAKREENRKARTWRDHLGTEEWKCYQLARIDYYLETERKDSIPVEDWDLLLQYEDDSEQSQSAWQQRLVKMYLLCKFQSITEEEEYNEQIRRLEDSLKQEENTICVKLSEAVSSLYAPWRNEQERLARWLMDSEQSTSITVREDNFALLCCQAKGYLFLNQYKRSEKILHRVIPYLQFYHRHKFLAEELFEQAVISWGDGRHGQALRNTIESFMITGKSRYVGFYTAYEKKGKEVLEAYVDWLSKNSPGGWHRKKKYNYGNVLRMPQEDYMEVILRCARRQARTGHSTVEENTEEHLTMMETIILHDINRGLTNAEICQELNLKLPTVKSHIYNLYKKLGVNSRVQAILRGKEQGILD